MTPAEQQASSDAMPAVVLVVLPSDAVIALEKPVAAQHD